MNHLKLKYVYFKRKLLKIYFDIRLKKLLLYFKLIKLNKFMQLNKPQLIQLLHKRKLKQANKHIDIYTHIDCLFMFFSPFFSFHAQFDYLDAFLLTFGFFFFFYFVYYCCYIKTRKNISFHKGRLLSKTRNIYEKDLCFFSICCCVLS